MAFVCERTARRTVHPARHSLQLAAAAETTRTFECMVYENPLRDAIAKAPVGEASGLVDGQLVIPQGPGLGIEIDRDVLDRLRVT